MAQGNPVYFVQNGDMFVTDFEAQPLAEDPSKGYLREVRLASPAEGKVTLRSFEDYKLAKKIAEAIGGDVITLDIEPVKTDE